MRVLGKCVAGLAAGLAALVAAGCGTSPPAPATPTGAPPLPLSSPQAATGHVGAGCGFIPDHGDGSFHAISGQRVVNATSSQPQLSVFTSAIKSASLSGKLDKMKSFTLFVPVNSAFAALDKSDVSFLRKQSNLVQVVRRQVVPERITPARIASGGSVTTLAGSKLTLGKSGSDYRVDQATVVCGNIKAANGTIYVIDRVLLPPR
ncbi:MAG TPA: fasciclin domain-containing protein [Streptosporangiaceae bacterium]|nr:fasciclin domain-containing protein [Streptosporangiaceae bacterium]